MIHLYSKNGKLSMWSLEPIDAPEFQHDEIEELDEHVQLLKENKVDRCENGVLIEKDPPISLSPSAEDIKTLINDADTETLKSIISEIALKLS